VYLTCSKKLTGSQLSPPHGTNKKLKCETKNKMMSVIGPVQSRCHEGSPEKVESWYQKTTLCLKKAPTLTSCSFGKNRLILTILGKQHQQTFKNDMRVFNFPCSFILPTLLLYLLLNIATEMTRNSVFSSVDCQQKNRFKFNKCSKVMSLRLHACT